MATLAFIKLGVLAYLLLWGISILTEHYLAGRSESDRRRLIKLQKLCQKMAAFRLSQKKINLEYKKQHPGDYLRTPVNPALRDSDPRPYRYETWKVRYYEKDDENSPTFPDLHSPKR